MIFLAQSDKVKTIKITVKDNRYDVEYSKNMTSFDVIAILEIARDRISELETKDIKVHIL